MSASEKENKGSFTVLSKVIDFDLNISEKIHNMELDDNTDLFLYLIEKIYSPFCIVLYLFILFGYYTYKQETILIWRPLVHVIVIHIIGRLLQSYIARPKPKWKETIKRRYKVKNTDNQYSMPNNDIMQAANFAIFLILYLNNFCGVFLVPLLIVAKIIFSYNYIFDTLTGVILGALISFILCLLFK